jgi:hypothetical protein
MPGESSRPTHAREDADRKKRRVTSMNKMLGVILIVIGIVGLVWGGFSYTTREKVVDIGPIHASRDKNHSVPLPPIVGAIALIGGIAIVATSKNS